MPGCCSCNSKGKCRNCSCVKVSIPFPNCAPYRYGNCVNIQDSSTSQTLISDASEASSDSSLQLVPNPPFLSSSFQLVPDPPSLSITLPFYRPMSSATFRWGSVEGGTFIDDLNRAYEDVTKWKSNCFKLPQGMQGKNLFPSLQDFLKHLLHVLHWNLLPATVMPILVLQKPRNLENIVIVLSGEWHYG